jgi:hypothetical protein
MKDRSSSLRYRVDRTPRHTAAQARTHADVRAQRGARPRFLDVLEHQGCPDPATAAVVFQTLSRPARICRREGADPPVGLGTDST